MIATPRATADNRAKITTNRKHDFTAKMVDHRADGEEDAAYWRCE